MTSCYRFASWYLVPYRMSTETLGPCSKVLKNWLYLILSKMSMELFVHDSLNYTFNLLKFCLCYFCYDSCTKSRHFQQDRISRPSWHGSNMLMGIFDRTKLQGPFGMDQVSLWVFWLGPNIKNTLAWTNVNMAILGRKKCPEGCYTLCYNQIFESVKSAMWNKRNTQDLL